MQQRRDQALGALDLAVSAEGRGQRTFRSCSSAAMRTFASEWNDAVNSASNVVSIVAEEANSRSLAILDYMLPSDP